MRPEDPYALFTALASLIVGTQLGAIFGPYVLILIASTAGSMAALGRRDPAKKPTGFVFIAIVNVIAVCVTSIASYLVAKYVTTIDDPRTLFAPVALAIGFVGLDWPELIPYLWDKWTSFRNGGGAKNG